ncbi:MAG: hypothetical protein ABIQ31_25770 [Ferruginibacter sp.]
MSYSIKERQVVTGLVDRERSDMQGLIARGYNNLNSATYILLQIEEVISARAYFNYLIDNHITSAVNKNAEGEKIKEPDCAVHLAFTSRGLRNLGLHKDIIDTFSREFLEGMDYSYPDPDHPSARIKERSSLLGDTKQNKPANWHWGNDEHPVDCMIMLYATNDAKLYELAYDVYLSKQHGLIQVHEAKTNEYVRDISKEHFGFQDGISQPIIKGFSQSDLKNIDTDKLVNPGEFILGYKNTYNNFSPSPYVNNDADSCGLAMLPGLSDKKDLGKNGTYLVFRQIEQHIDKFWSFLYWRSQESGRNEDEKAIRLAAKMIGRWPDGRPLVTCPERPDLVDAHMFNNFNYVGGDDEFGLKCPLGAHIRRTNPRDQVHTGRNAKDSDEMSGKHRMLRRGRIYGEPLDREMRVNAILDEVKKSPEFNRWRNHGCGSEKGSTGENEKTEINRGLHFICLVSDIARQFEFVQNVWANTSTFADLCNEVDPIISPRPTKDQPDCHEFTTPQDVVRNRYTNVPEFTTVVGGAYFFMPGINALRYLVK